MIFGIYQCVSISVWFVLLFRSFSLFSRSLFRLPSIFSVPAIAFNFWCTIRLGFGCFFFLFILHLVASTSEFISCSILMAFLAALLTHNIKPICMDAAYPTLIQRETILNCTNQNRNIPRAPALKTPTQRWQKRMLRTHHERLWHGNAFECWSHCSQCAHFWF